MSYFVESEHFFLNQYGIIKEQFKMPRATISQYFHFILLIRLFFCQYRPKKSREKSYSQINRFLSWFSNMKKFCSWKSLVKSLIGRHSIKSSINLSTTSQFGIPFELNRFLSVFWLHDVMMLLSCVVWSYATVGDVVKMFADDWWLFSS